MRSIGQILQTTRLAKKMEISDVARITRIRSQFLIDLEADNYNSIQSSAVARGFIKNYAQFLNLPIEPILAIYRRDYIEDIEGKIVPRGLADPISEFSFWTPQTSVVAVIVCLLTIFGMYLIFQFRILVGAPTLTIMRPVDKYKTSQDTVELVGATDPEATLSVNNQLIALDKGGTFRFRIPLPSEVNLITVVAASKYGKTRSQSLTIYHE